MCLVVVVALASLTPRAHANNAVAENGDVLAVQALDAEARLLWPQALDLWRQLFNDSVAHQLWPRAQLALEKLASAAERGDALDFRALLENEQRYPPWLAARIRWHLLNQRLRAGEVTDAAHIATRLGVIRNVFVCGPFDNELDAGFDQLYPPEQETAFDPEVTYASFGHEVRWRPLPFQPPAGTIALGSLMAPKSTAVAYVSAMLWSPHAVTQAATIAAGCAGRTKMWLNGQLLYAQNEARSFAFDQVQVTGALHPGWNRLLLKSCADQEPWDLVVRLVDIMGQPMATAGLSSTRVGETRHYPSPAMTSPRPSKIAAMAELAERTAAGKASAMDWFNLGFLEETCDPQPIANLAARFAYEQASRLAPKQAHFHFRFALMSAHSGTASVHRDHNAQQRALRHTLALNEHHAQAAFLLAQLALENDQLDRAQNYIDRARALAPEAIEPLIGAHALAKAKGQGLLARQLEHRVRRHNRYHSSAHAQALIVHAAASASDYLALLPRLEALVASNGTNSAVRRKLAAALWDTDRQDRAVVVLKRGIELNPFELGLRQDLASKLSAVERFEEAGDELQRLLTIAPHATTIIGQLAENELYRGKTTEAGERLEQILTLDPNNTKAQRRLELLNSQRARRLDRFAVNAERALATPLSGADDSSFPIRMILHDTVIELQPDGRTHKLVNQVFRITNANGSRANRSFAVSYAQGEQTVRFEDARVIRRDGSEVRAKTPPAAFARAGDFTQYRQYRVQLPVLEVGDTIVVRYRIIDREASFFGSTFSLAHPFQAAYPADHIRLVILTPAENALHSRVRGALAIDHTTTIDASSGYRLYTFSARSTTPIQAEPFMPPITEVGTVVEVSSFEDWTAFATWYWQLIHRQADSSAPMRAMVTKLTANATTREAKIRAIYGFVSQHIRYNDHWEFGIHGYKPYKASRILERRFGDCKDKALLINTMLAEVGIDAYPVLLMATARRHAEDISVPLVGHFNHCISFVPAIPTSPTHPANAPETATETASATTAGWFLDGTANFHAADELPAMDRGAAVVVVTPQGVRRLRIPQGRPAQVNGLKESQRIRVRKNGQVHVQITTQGFGEAAAYIRQSLNAESTRSDRLRDLYAHLAPGVEVHTQGVKITTADSPASVDIAANYRITDLSTLAPFRNPWFHRLYADRLADFAQSTSRAYDVLLPTPIAFVSTITVDLDPSMHVSELPPGLKLSHPAGHFTESWRVEGSRLHCERQLTLSATRVATSDYEDWRAFVVEIDRAFRQRLRIAVAQGAER